MQTIRPIKMQSNLHYTICWSVLCGWRTLMLIGKTSLLVRWIHCSWGRRSLCLSKFVHCVINDNNSILVETITWNSFLVKVFNILGHLSERTSKNKIILLSSFSYFPQIMNIDMKTFKYHVSAPMGRFQLELIYLFYFPPFFHLTVVSVL